jgi:hypothetical protein
MCRHFHQLFSVVLFRFAFFGTLEWGQSIDVIQNLDSAENAVTVTFDTGIALYYI